MPHRFLRFRIDFGVGVMNPSDINNYENNENFGTPSYSKETWRLTPAIDLSGAYYPTDYFGIRPSFILIMDTPSMLFARLGEGLQAYAPGLSLDLVRDRRGLARFFVSPGLRYYFASYSADWNDDLRWTAHGIGAELAVGSELSFGEKRAKGISLAIVAQRARLGVSGRPQVPLYSAPAINTIDLSAIFLRVGFQMGS
jgi:hypothetical protein